VYKTIPQTLTDWFKRSVSLTTAMALTAVLSGCSLMVGSATENLAQSLSSAILNSDDIDTVEQGLPAYLLLLDGLIESDPNNSGLLLAAAKLNSAYAGVFTSNPQQAKLLSQKALNYAASAVCQKKKQACQITSQPFDNFQQVIKNFKINDLYELYTLGSSWAGWIEANSDDWNAIANIARIQTIMERVILLDESYELGSAHIYLGVMATLLPPALGGKPDVGQQHFQRAIALSDGKNLMAKVTYARRYARLLFERELHDRLLNEVVAADAKVSGLTLINTLAKKQAQELLRSADEYF